MRMVVIGFGTVGQNVARILQSKEKRLLREFGFRPRIVAVVDRGGAMIDPKGLDLNRVLTVKQTKGSVAQDPELGRPREGAKEVIDGVEAEAVLELTPTNMVDGEPGLSHIKAALRSGRHVITTNKAPLAIAMPSLMEMASYNKVLLRFSGAVGGGTPVLDLAKKCFNGNKIESLRGILNGTTNYILTRMAASNTPMDTALKEAQTSGYAEADPSYDIDGVDTACKLVILANWVIGRESSIKDVEIEGIRKVTSEDVEEARRKNSQIKLIGSISDEMRVQPEPIPQSHPLCVGGILNAVSFKTELMGEVTIVGKGAGGVETASAVLRDIVDVRRILAE
jgi:homoserine dehydrogenase